MSKLKWKLLIKKRASSTAQGIPPGKENLPWVATTITPFYVERDSGLLAARGNNLMENSKEASWQLPESQSRR
jgi:hypothetical protein